MPRYNPLSGCLWTPHEHNRKNHLNQLGSELSFKHQQTIQPQRANRSACLHRIAPSHQPAQSIRRLAHLLPTHRAAAFLLIRQQPILYFNIGLIALGEDSRDSDYLGLDCLPAWRDSYQIFAQTLSEDLIFCDVR